VFGLGLWGYEFDPNFQKDDTRTLAQYLSSFTTADDVIVMDAPEPLDYYYHGPAKLEYVPGDPDTVAAILNQKAAGKKRIVQVQWFLSTSDPEQLVPYLLQKYGKLTQEHTFRGYWAHTYDIPPDVNFVLDEPATGPGANFAGLLQLEGAALSPATAADSALVKQLGQPVAASGQQLMLALRWKLLHATSKEYKASAYLTDDHGHLGGQADLTLYDGQATTSHWQPGAEAVNYYALQTIPGLMPGKYTLNVAVYANDEQERLSVLDAAGAP